MLTAYLTLLFSSLILHFLVISTTFTRIRRNMTGYRIVNIATRVEKEKRWNVYENRRINLLLLFVGWSS